MPPTSSQPDFPTHYLHKRLDSHSNQGEVSQAAPVIACPRSQSRSEPIHCFPSVLIQGLPSYCPLVDCRPSPVMRCTPFP